MTDEHDDALLEWINTCAEVPVASFDDLADGRTLRAILHQFLPDAFPRPSRLSQNSSAGNNLTTLRRQLDAYFDGKFPGLDDPESNKGGKNKIRSFAEATLLAIVQSPNNVEAVTLIGSLSEEKQEQIMAILQPYMALGEAQQMNPDQQFAKARRRSQAAYGELLAQRRASGMLFNDGPEEVDRAVAEDLYHEVMELREKLHVEENASEKAEKTEKSAYNKVQQTRAYLSAEEEHLMEQKKALSNFAKGHSEDIKHCEMEINVLNHELDSVRSSEEDVPRTEARLNKQLRLETEEEQLMYASCKRLEEEVQFFVLASSHDDAHVNGEMTSYRQKVDVLTQEISKVEQSEMMERKMASEVFQDLVGVEQQTKERHDKARQQRSHNSSEEQSLMDVEGLLEFRKSELKQLEMQVDNNGDEDELDGVVREFTGKKNHHEQASPEVVQDRQNLRKELVQLMKKQTEAKNMSQERATRVQILKEKIAHLEQSVESAKAAKEKGSQDTTALQPGAMGQRQAPSVQQQSGSHPRHSRQQPDEGSQAAGEPSSEMPSPENSSSGYPSAGRTSVQSAAHRASTGHQPVLEESGSTPEFSARDFDESDVPYDESAALAEVAEVTADLNKVQTAVDSEETIVAQLRSELENETMAFQAQQKQRKLNQQEVQEHEDQLAQLQSEKVEQEKKYELESKLMEQHEVEAEAQVEKERHKLEEERQKLKEVETEQQHKREVLEQKKEMALEKRKEREIEKRKQHELAQQKQLELEKQKEAEVEKQREAEIAKQREAELEKQREAELEKQREAELEKQALENRQKKGPSAVDRNGSALELSDRQISSASIAETDGAPDEDEGAPKKKAVATPERTADDIHLLQSQVVMRDHMVNRLRRHVDDRRSAILEEQDMLLEVIHEVGTRYQLLLGKHKALQESRRRRSQI